MKQATKQKRRPLAAKEGSGRAPEGSSRQGRAARIHHSYVEAANPRPRARPGEPIQVTANAELEGGCDATSAHIGREARIGRHPPSEDNSRYLYYSVAEVLDDWLLLLGMRSRHTARTYRSAVIGFLAFAGCEPDKLSPRSLMRYPVHLARSGLAPTSIAHHVAAVRAFLRHCRDLGIDVPARIELLAAPPVPAGVLPRRCLSKEEASQLMAAAGVVSPRARVVVALLLLTGMRSGELARARWCDLFRDGHGNIGLVVRGKGGKERAVLINTGLWRLLREERRLAGRSPEIDSLDASPVVAGRHRSHYSTGGIWKLVRVTARRAGIAKPVSPHWLRHTFATLLATGGASPFQIKNELGHSRVATSERYVNWAQGLQSSAATQLGLSLDSTQLLAASANGN